VVARKSSSTSRTTGVALALLALGLLARPLSTAVLVVDDNCSLVDAIHAANENLPQGGCPGGDPGEDLIMLTSDVVLTEGIPYGQDGTPEIVEDLTLQGSGFSVTRESDGDFRLFRVGVGARLHALDLAIRGGSAFFGGAIYNRGSTTLTRTDLSDHTGIDRGGAVYNLFGSLTLVDSTISASKTFGSGAGIWNYGDLTIRGSTISASSGVGFPVYIGGDEYSFQVEISDSTISDNEVGGLLISMRQGEVSIRSSTISGNLGAGIITRYLLDLENSTVSDNTDTGIRVGFDDPEGGLLRVSNSSIVGNLGGGLATDLDPLGDLTLSHSVISGAAPNCSGRIIDAGGNFDEDGSCGPGVGSLSGLDPVLADNGGQTRTHALLPGSSAIDGAGNCGLDVDQRGFARSDGACDSGAFEFAAEPAALELVTNGDCPGLITFSLTGGTPDGLAGLIYSAGLGADPLAAGPCAGADSGLSGPQFLTTIDLDASGGSVIPRNVPPSACGLLVQVVDGESCRLSDIETLD